MRSVSAAVGGERRPVDSPSSGTPLRLIRLKISPELAYRAGWLLWDRTAPWFQDCCGPDLCVEREAICNLCFCPLRHDHADTARADVGAYDGPVLADQHLLTRKERVHTFNQLVDVVRRSAVEDRYLLDVGK